MTHIATPCIDMTDLSIEVCKARNVQREPLKRVPEEAIDKMYARFATKKVPTGITVLRPDELDRIWMHPIDLSQYKKIHHIGDIMLERIQRIATREPKGDVTLVKGLKPPECFIIALQNTYQQSEFSGAS